MDHSHLVGAILASKHFSNQPGTSRNHMEEEDRFYEIHGEAMWVMTSFHRIARCLKRL